MVNIVGDIAGRYDQLLALLKKMPDDEVISIGDMIDRGPKSKEVIEWFMKNGKAILGNHEHMMLDFYRNENYYEHDVWQQNGGSVTLTSFDPAERHRAFEVVPIKVLSWVAKLPLYVEIDGYLISHSFINSRFKNVYEACDLGPNAYTEQSDNSIIWNRSNPIRRPEYKLQIAGHNSQFGLRRFADEKGEFAICIDDSKKKRLTGIHIPSLTIYQEGWHT